MGIKKKWLVWIGFLVIACGIICLFNFLILSHDGEEKKALTKRQNLEAYVRKSYLVPHEVFEYAPTNQYKEIGKVDIQFFLPENKVDETFRTEYLTLNDGLFLVRYYYRPEKVALERIDQAKDPQVSKFQGIIKQFLDPQNKDLAKELIFESYIKTRKGDFLFFALKKIGINSQDFKADDLKRERLFWQSFVYIQKPKVFGPSVEINREDPETGGYERSLWDIFLYHGREYILIKKIVYEAHNFEIFEKTSRGLIKVHEFCYGGL